MYELYLPLRHEEALRETLDSLSYLDAILPRLRKIGYSELERVFVRDAGQRDEAYIKRICDFVDSKFGGYSIYQVKVRFRAGKLTTKEEALKSPRYLMDETTAVTRFIFTCQDDEYEKVSFLFDQLFMTSITCEIRNIQNNFSAPG